MSHRARWSPGPAYRSRGGRRVVDAGSRHRPTGRRRSATGRSF